MPEGLLYSLGVTARNIGIISGIEEKFTEVIGDEAFIKLHKPIKEIVEKYDRHKYLVFQQEDADNKSLWTMRLDSLHTEKYQLLGIMATALRALAQPHLDKIQKSLDAAIKKIKKDAKVMSIMAMSSYSNEDKGYCVTIMINESEPMLICHKEPDILAQVVSAGLPDIVSKMVSKAKTKK